MGAAAARVDIGELSEAAADLKTIAAELSEAGRQPEAIEALRQAALIRPDDEDVRERLLEGVHRRRRTRPRPRVRGHRPSNSSRWPRRSRPPAGAATRWSCCARPRASTRKTPNCASTWRGPSWPRGNMEAASEYLTAETAGSDPQLQLMAAELTLRGERRRRHGARSRRARAGSRAPRRHRCPRLETRRRTAGCRVQGRRTGGGDGRRADRLGVGRGHAPGIRDARAEPHPRVDAAGRNLRGRRPRSDDVRAHRRSWPTRTSPRTWGPKPGSSPRTSSRASRGSGPTSSASAARWSCSEKRIPMA